VEVLLYLSWRAGAAEAGGRTRSLGLALYTPCLAEELEFLSAVEELLRGFGKEQTENKQLVLKQPVP
jgi:hypothetical protein